MSALTETSLTSMKVAFSTAPEPITVATAALPGCPSSSKSRHCLHLCCLLCHFTHLVFLWLIVVCRVGSRGGVSVELQSPHPPLSLICCPLLLPRIPLPGKAYVILHCLCHLCPLWAWHHRWHSSSTKHKVRCIVIIIAPPLLFAGANAALPVILHKLPYSSSLSSLLLPPSTPAYYGWLLCVGQAGLDIINVVIASQILLIIIIVSPPSPPGA
jgi:hypothetical protein